MHRHQDINRWPMRLLAFVVAILLFLFVNYENSRSVSSLNPGSNASVTTEEMLEEIPIEINVDSERYYVTGIPQSANVKLKGPQSLVTQFMATSNITAETPDLNALGIGEHTIELQIQDLPNRVEAEFSPQKIDITIERRVSQEFEVGLEFDESLVAEGFQVGEAQLSDHRALLSGPQSEIEKVDRVVVTIPEEEAPYSENINASYPVTAYDAQGELLDVSVEPAQINVSIPISGAEKEVPIRVESRGGVEGFDYDVDIASDQMGEITIRGPQSILNQITNIPVVVNLDGITSSTSRTIDLQRPLGVTEMSLDAVTVVINAQAKDNTSRGEPETNNSPTEEEQRVEENEEETGQQERNYSSSKSSRSSLDEKEKEA